MPCLLCRRSNTAPASHVCKRHNTSIRPACCWCAHEAYWPVPPVVLVSLAEPHLPCFLACTGVGVLETLARPFDRSRSHPAALEKREYALTPMQVRHKTRRLHSVALLVVTSLQWDGCLVHLTFGPHMLMTACLAASPLLPGCPRGVAAPAEAGVAGQGAAQGPHAAGEAGRCGA